MQREKPTHPPRHVSAGASKITYADLISRLTAGLTEELLAGGRSLKRADNFRSAMRGWMKEFGLPEASPVGAELGSEYSAALARRTATLRAAGVSRQTISAHRSMLSRCRDEFAALRQEEERAAERRDLSATLDALFVASGMTETGVCRLAGLSTISLNNWRTGRCVPSKGSLPALARLEAVLGTDPGTLAAKLPHVLYGEKGSYRVGQTAFRRHAQELQKRPFGMNTFPPRLRAEWDSLYLFYTDAAWAAARGMKRNGRWRVRAGENFCPTRERIRRALASYFGYLCLPAEGASAGSGKGYSPEAVSLALISDAGLISDYLRFKKERTYLQRHNGSTLLFLTLCAALLRPETGFIWQSPELGARLPDPVARGAWQDWCGRNRSVINEIRKKLVKDGEIAKTRDPFVPIGRIITDNRHPVDALLDFADAYEADLPPANAPPRPRAAHFQLVLLIRFATFIPLRVYNFCAMTYRRDNTGNLYAKTDGSWWVRFSASELKNHLGAAKDAPFDVPLHESLWPYVEGHLFTHRPSLAGADDCDYVFRPARHCRVAARGARVPECSLWRQIYVATQSYIPDCAGFGMHAFRHIVATEYMKNYRDGVSVAAAILNDRESTVKKCYGLLLPSDRFDDWYEHVNGRISNRHRERESARSRLRGVGERDPEG
jgi:hypothetical protein